MRVFVFPLGKVVFQPSTSKPLNIFEPRYIQMVKDSLRTGTPIAIGHVDNTEIEHKYFVGEKLGFVRPVAGFGMPLILEERADGSMLIFLQSQGKCFLGNVTDVGFPYIVAEAHPILENLELSQSQSAHFMTVHKVLMGWLKTNIPDPANLEQLIRNIQTPSEVIGCIASYLILDHDLQQLILESDDINEKVHLVQGMLASGEAV
ncbi:MAG: LON peptidase substrate-binding domain-containing protein [Pseudobdellovibrionaceae bacterium]